MTRENREFLGCGRRLEGGPGVQGALLGKPATYAPDRAFDAKHIFLDLDVDLRRRSLSGSCETTVQARRSGVRRLEFNAVNLKIAKILVDGKPAKFSQKDGTLTVTLGKELSESAETIVTIKYQVVDPEAGLHFV